MDQRRYYLPSVILLSSLLSAAAIFLEWANPIRWILVFWFLMFCPGMAFIHLLPSKDGLTRFFMVIIISLGLDTVVAQVMLYLGKWSPGAILLILLGLCLLGILWQILPMKRRPARNIFA